MNGSDPALTIIELNGPLPHLLVTSPVTKCISRMNKATGQMLTSFLTSGLEAITAGKAQWKA